MECWRWCMWSCRRQSMYVLGAMVVIEMMMGEEDDKVVKVVFKEFGKRKEHFLWLFTISPNPAASNIKGENTNQIQIHKKDKGLTKSKEKRMNAASAIQLFASVCIIMIIMMVSSSSWSMIMLYHDLKWLVDVSEPSACLLFLWGFTDDDNRDVFWCFLLRKNCQ